MRRRTFLKTLGVGALLGGGFTTHHYWPDEGFVNPCRTARLPDELARDERVQAAWAGLDHAALWDAHVHLLGEEDGEPGVWVNPAMSSLGHPIQYVQKRFYENAACVSAAGENINQAYIDRLIRLLGDFPAGAKLVLLAFDYHHDEHGRVIRKASSYFTSNAYARRVAARYPRHFEWIASIHPYREDAVQALEQAAMGGARAVKWLPPAMGIDPGSARCDVFYETLARLGLPLLTHAGDELAVHGAGAQAGGNPLLLRRALDHGVKVIVAHCATLGYGVDLDKGKAGPRVRNFDLFARLMDEPRYEGLVFGELSAVTQINRMGEGIATILQREAWHGRLINGSDYPLPGVMPLFSLQGLVGMGLLESGQADLLSRIRAYNPLLFDFLCKRALQMEGRGLPGRVFESRRVLEPGYATIAS